MNRLLPTRRVEKPWGREELPLPFNETAEAKIGEIWFEPPPELAQLLVKYIFTSEKLSVQVHPSDAQTRASGDGAQGKEECWFVISAEKDAKLGIGFEAPLSPEAMRQAALDGSIEGLMTWHAVKPGDFFYIPANTVHAIGAGIGLIEVQQNSDITYRLYDYGRPRELHLDKGVAIARGEPYPGTLHRHVPDEGTAELVDGPYFRLHRVHGDPDARIRAAYANGPLLVIPVRGEVSVADEPAGPGTCALASGIGAVRIGSGGLALLAQPVTTPAFAN